jgi:putative sigma-54 modulation protein
MQLSVTFRHMEATEALKEYARQKLERIGKYIRKPIECRVVFSVERHHHIADMTLKVDGITIKGAERSEDMYSSIDVLVDKMERQIRKYKEKLRDHKPWEHQPERRVQMAILEGEAIEQRGETRILKSESMPVPALSVDEAIMRMDLSQDRFLIFNKDGTGALHVLYRLEDGNYGMVEAGTAAPPVEAP